MSEHGEALEYDLMTSTRFTLDDLGGALSERALLSFVRCAPPRSLLARDVGGDQQAYAWAQPELLPTLVASVIDELRNLQWTVAQVNSRRKLRRPKPIKRPGVKDDTERIGADPIPVAQWNEFWERGDKWQT